MVSEATPNLGFKVRIKFSHSGTFKGGEQINRNVTEIHYNFRNSPAYVGMPDRYKRLAVAFESDIHGTGVTYELDDLWEFEATAETELAESF